MFDWLSSFFGETSGCDSKNAIIYTKTIKKQNLTKKHSITFEFTTTDGNYIDNKPVTEEEYKEQIYNRLATIIATMQAKQIALAKAFAETGCEDAKKFLNDLEKSGKI
jgi:hypothetical protein